MTEPQDFTAKIYVARAQLRTALWLFLEDMDPISIHALSCAGCEILAEITVATNTFSPSLIVKEYVDEADPNWKIKDIRNANWNAFKHVHGWKNTIRDDRDRIQNFSDSENDALLYQGWYDLAALKVQLPVEAQIYLCWYAANYPESATPLERQSAEALFKFTDGASRPERKSALYQCCADWRSNPELRASDQTDLLPLTTKLPAP